MKTWIGSDFHWGHARILEFCPETRGRYKNVQHMDEQMVLEWNEIVAPEDTVYMLGDVAFYHAGKAAAIVQRLNGNKILVEGNHDRKNLESSTFRNCFSEVHQLLRYVHNGQLVIMCHYPLSEWDQMHRGAVHFYGHLHQSTVDKNQYRARNVGMDCTGKILMDLDSAIADALKGEIKPHHH